MALDPTQTEAAMEAGVIHYYRLGEAAQAMALYDHVLAREPAHYGARYQRAVTLLALGRTDEARVAWAAFAPLAEQIGDRTSLDAAPAAFRLATANTAVAR